MAPHSTQRRRFRERGGKGTTPMFRLIQPCSYFLSVDFAGVDEVDDVVAGVEVEEDDDEVVLSDELLVSDDDDFLLPYRSAPQPPPLSTKELLLTRRFILPFAPHFSHFAGGASPIFCSRSISWPHFSHSYS